jgi:hypothetical protein
VGFTIFILVTAAAAAGVFFAVRGKAAGAPALPDKERFAKAFTPVPVSGTPAKQDSKSPGMKTHVVGPPDPNEPIVPNLEGGESTMAI